MKEMKERMQSTIELQIDNLKQLMDEKYLGVLETIVNETIDVLRQDKKILIAGNGGSAADAQHFAAELVGRFETERRGLAAIALTTDSSILTSVSNDYSYLSVFSRQIQAIASEGDLFIGISTSGNSENIIRAMEEAKKRKVHTIGFLGKDGGVLKNQCDLSLIAPSNQTARIQEMHELCIHMICSFVDDYFTK